MLAPEFQITVWFCHWQPVMVLVKLLPTAEPFIEYVMSGGFAPYICHHADNK